MLSPSLTISQADFSKKEERTENKIADAVEDDEQNHSSGQVGKEDRRDPNRAGG
jgi:hypothetical protein